MGRMRVMRAYVKRVKKFFCAHEMKSAWALALFLVVFGVSNSKWSDAQSTPAAYDAIGLVSNVRSGR